MKKPHAFKKLWVAVLAFFFFVLLIASFFGEKGWIAIYKTQKTKESLEDEIAELTRIRERLEREIEDLKVNAEAVERKAREQLTLMKPVEIVIIKK